MGVPETRVPTPATPAAGRLYLHPACHLGSRLVAWIDVDNRLTIACGTCEKPVLSTSEPADVLAAIRRLGCQMPGHGDHKRGPGDG